jgi:hypothetical protein
MGLRATGPIGYARKLLILARSDATFAAGTGYALGYTHYDSQYERGIGQGAPPYPPFYSCRAPTILRPYYSKLCLFFGRHKSKLRQMDTVALPTLYRADDTTE